MGVLACVWGGVGGGGGGEGGFLPNNYVSPTNEDINPHVCG